MKLPTEVDPGQLRFHQAITGLICVEAIVFSSPAAAVIALGLIALDVGGPRLSPSAWLYRLFARPAPRLAAAPPARFSHLLGVGLLAAGLILLVVGVTVVGWVLVGVVAGAGLVGALTGFCLGCRAYLLLLGRRRAAGPPTTAL